MYLRELLKSQIFHDTIVESEWLKFKSFSLGGWASDYGLLYTLYRIIDDIKPTSILEFGLGQSSKMIHQYSSFFEEVKAITIEHDLNWVNFFRKNIKQNYEVNITVLDLYEKKVKGHNTYAYDKLEQEILSCKFDLILVDAPYGTKHYSRSQIIDIVPQHLCDSFCIVIDDYNRKGERETVKELCKKLTDHNISFKSTILFGMKEHFLICSDDWGFLTTIG